MVIPPLTNLNYWCFLVGSFLKRAIPQELLVITLSETLVIGYNHWLPMSEHALNSRVLVTVKISPSVDTDIPASLRIVAHNLHYDYGLAHYTT